MACGWFLVAQMEGLFDGYNWVTQSDMADDMERSTMTQYVLSLYHSIMVMATIGSNIQPVTNAERVYSLLTMLCGASVFAYGLTNMSSLIFNLNHGDVVYRQRMDELNAFLVQRHVRKDLRLQIRQYFAYLHGRLRFFDADSLLQELSSTVRGLNLMNPKS